MTFVMSDKSWTFFLLLYLPCFENWILWCVSMAIDVFVLMCMRAYVCMCVRACVRANVLVCTWRRFKKVSASSPIASQLISYSFCST